MSTPPCHGLQDFNAPTLGPSAIAIHDDSDMVWVGQHGNPSD